MKTEKHNVHNERLSMRLYIDVNLKVVKMSTRTAYRCLPGSYPAVQRKKKIQTGVPAERRCAVREKTPIMRTIQFLGAHVRERRGEGERTQ
jgi:hypothetical protein